MKFYIHLFLTCLLMLNTAHLFANDQTESTHTQVNNKAINFLQSQVDGGLTVGSALSLLIERYPERSSELVLAAFKAYPEKYQDVLTASISANPSFIDDFIMVAIEADVADTVEIVEIAIMADPSYAQDVTNAACKHSPEYFNEIVKAAVHAEPDSADQIAKRLVNAYPSRTFEVLITAIKEVPFVGKYVLDALLATVDAGDAERSNEMIIVSVEQLAQHPDAISRLVSLAEAHQIDAQLVRDSAVKGGLDKASITALIDQHYKE